MRYDKKRLDYQSLKVFFQSALAVFLISLPSTLLAGTCCNRHIQTRITAPGSISAREVNMMKTAVESGFTTKGPREADCPISVELVKKGSSDYLIDCEVKVLPSDIKGQYFMFYAKLVDPNHGYNVLAGPHHVSWHGEYYDYYINKPTGGSRSLLKELIQYLRPFDDKIEDYERIPESCTIEPEKEEVEGGESITINLTNIQDAKGRTPKPWQRLVVKVDIGKIKNGVNKHPWYIFEVNDGSVVIQYEAPEKCDFDTEIIKVSNSCETTGSLESTVPHREIARREIKVDDFRPVACSIEPKKKKLNPGEDTTILLSDFVEFEGRDLRPEEKIMVKAQEGRITNGKPHGKYRIFAIGNGTVTVAYRAPDQNGVEQDTVTVHNVCENRETGKIEPKKEIARTNIKIIHSSVTAKITITKTNTRDFNETKGQPGSYHSIEQSNYQENFKCEIFLTCEKEPRIVYKEDRKSFKIKIHRYYYLVKSARIQSASYEGQYSGSTKDSDSVGLRHSRNHNRSTSGSDFKLKSQASDPSIEITFDPSTGLITKVHLPSYYVTGTINEKYNVSGVKRESRKEWRYDDKLVPYNRNETKTSDLEFSSTHPSFDDPESCSKATGNMNTKFLRGQCSQIRNHKYLTEEETYKWEVTIRKNQ